MHDATTQPLDHEYLVLGAGPAGLQMGYHLDRAGRSYRILEAGDSPGTFFKTFPRHRKLISINKLHTGYDDPEVNLRWDWNSLLTDDAAAPRFPAYSERYFPPADRLVEYLGDYARHHGLRIVFGARVVSVRREGEGFRVEDERGRAWTAARVVVATGVNRLYVPPIPGIELAESYADAPLDPSSYAGERVLVLGKGNSGFEMAEAMIETAAIIHVASPESIRMAWKTHHVGHLRALNNGFLDTYQLKCQNAVLDATVERIRKLPDGRLGATMAYSHAQGEREELFYDRIIHCAGFRFDVSIFDDECRPALVLDDRFPAQTSEWESVNVPGVFFAGTLTQVRDYKKSASSFIHGFRYNTRTLHRLLERRYHGRELPSRDVPVTPEELTDSVLHRCNRSSALWQQFGYLGDLVVVPVAGAPARYLEEVPVDWTRERDAEGAWGAGLRLLVTLEFGEARPDPFRIERSPDPADAQESSFLHPVVRRIEGGETVAELHLIEDLYAEWDDEEAHRRPLLRFLDEQVAPAAAAASA